MFSHFLRKVLPFGRWAAPRTRAVALGHRIWHLTPEASLLFGGNGPDFDRWLADGIAVVVKSNPQRIVYRVALPDGTVFVKHCRITGVRAWAREVLRPAKARLEFENALALRERGIDAVVPLAWGRPANGAPGESFVITAAKDGAIPFLDFIEKSLPVERTSMRRQLARTLGEFLAKLHEAGVAHPDPHPGNLLVELRDAGAPHFHLIDLHAVRLGSPLSWAESRANLVLYNRWFQLRSSRTDRLRFWRAYCRGRGMTHEQTAAHSRELERATLASNLRFWAGRTARCLGSNRYYRKVNAGTVRGYAVRDLPDDVVREFTTNPDAVFSRRDAIVLKDSRTSSVVSLVVNTSEGSRTVVFKRINVRRWTEPLKNLVRPSPALRSWVNGHALRDRWLPTPRPLLVLHRYKLGLPTAGYLLTEIVLDPKPTHVDGKAYRGGWALPRILRTMHDRGVSHRDLKAANILLSHDGPTLIDLVGVRIGRSVPFRLRCRELARLNASFLGSPHVSRTVRLRFLHTYLAAGPRLGNEWKLWWKAILQATEAKVLKNRKAGRPLA